MSYLSKNTEKIISIIDDLNEINGNFNYDYFTNSNVKPYYDVIFKLYNNIDYNIISKEITNINTADFCGAFDLLDFLIKNNLLDEYKDISCDKDETLEDIIKNKKRDKCKIWINLHGKLLLRKLYLLKESNKIPENLIEKLSLIDEDLLSEFTPFDIIDYLGNSKLIKYNFLIEYENTKVTLKIVSKQVIKNTTLDRLIKNIFLMVSLKKQTSSVVEDFTIVLITTLFKKNLSKEYNVLGPREINSGLCIFNTRKILIFRKEEYEKLLIHELCHLLNLDFSVVNIQNIYDIVNLNPESETRINESITEILALIIHSIIVSINLTQTKKKNYNLGSTLINYEINFNLVQIAKILNHYGFNNANEFFCKYDNNDKFKQTTSVLSYFIIKTACLYNKTNLHIFLNNNFKKFNYINKQTALENYKKLVIDSLQNEEFHQDINFLMKNLHTKNKLFLDTLRMTCIEMI
jgi:hypothetical protein